MKDVKDKIHKEVVDEIDNTINELYNKKDLNSEEKEKLEHYLKLKEKNKSHKEILRECYFNLLDIIDNYMDIEEKEKKLIAIWIIGCYFHKQFNTYPYLFFNAMRGSGKTRLLKLISYLNNGILTTFPTETILFRCKDPLCLDEFERMDSKEKALLKELLNTAYKKGLYVLRTSKRKVLGKEEYFIEKFETFRPICMANIWGMDDVLGDRCLSLILEKSNNPIKTKKIENFEENNYITKTKISLYRCSLCSVVMSGGTSDWNAYLDKRYTLHTLTSYNTYNTLTTQQHTQKYIKQDIFFNKIDNSELNGRNLELFMPLFYISNYLGDDIFLEILEFSKIINKEKMGVDMENKDVLLYKFVSENCENMTWTGVKKLTDDFRYFLGDEVEEWINPRWLGRAIKRLNLILEKRRIGSGAEVILDTFKAKRKSMIFEIKEDKK